MIFKKMYTLGLCFISILFSLNTLAASGSAVISNEKLKTAPLGKAIKNQYIVILKNAPFNESSVNGLNTVTASLSGREQIKDNQQKMADISADFIRQHQATIRHQYHSKINGFAMTVNEQQLNEMLLDDRIAYIEEDTIVSIDAVQEDVTWGIDRIDQANLPLDNQYHYQYTGKGVTAYIIDTGIQATHSEFTDRVGTGIDYVNDGNGTDDCNGHGTHVAGTVGGVTYGVAKDVSLIPVRVLDCNGNGSTSNVIASLSWILENATQPAVVNMSLGANSSPSASYIAALTALVDAGIPVIVSSGNSPSVDACDRSPGAIPAAITVAATDFYSTEDIQADFSSYGECVDIFAPGDTIKSASIYGGYTEKSGTSMSAPHVAGVAVLYLESNPSADRYNVEAVLEANAVADLILEVENTPNLLVQTGFLSLTGTNTSLPIENAKDGGDEVLTYPAANAIDGSLDWEARFESTGAPVNLELDLGSVEYVTDIGISWGKGTTVIYSFEIWARADKSDDWIKVRKTSETSGTTSSIESYSITNINARYVRIKTHGNSSLNDVTIIKEVEVYGMNDNAVISTAYDDGTSHASFPAANAIDGNEDRSTRWAASDENAVNLTIGLEESSYVTHVAINWGDGKGVIYTLEIYARNGTSGEWTKVFDDISDGTSGEFEVFDITDINAQQIRIKSFGSSNNTNWTNISEVKIHGAVSRK